MSKSVGVLALQGGFDAHRRVLKGLGAQPRLIRSAADLDQADGLILPGGESTTMLKLLKEEDLYEPVARFAATKPVFGTCAGAILLARHVSNPQQESLGVLDLDIERNAYGRQAESHVAHLDLDPALTNGAGGAPFEAVFIRAPIIRSAGPQVRILAAYRGDPVLVEQGRHLAATFHPELGTDTRVHKLFLEKL